MLLIETANPPFSRAGNSEKGELAERFKIYDETIGGNEGWKLVKENKGIKVYHRKTSLTAIKVFKGVAELETDLTTLCAFLMDTCNFPSWIVLCDSAELLEPADEDADKIDQVVYHLYTVNRPPWPIKPRDNVIYSVATQDPETLTLRIKAVSVPDAIPYKEECIRCPLLMVEWKLRPLNNGKTEFTFETLIDVGGWVPAWAINFYAVDVPYTTIQKIRKQMPFKDKYRQNKIKWLKVPPSHAKATDMVMNKEKKKTSLRSHPFDNPTIVEGRKNISFAP